MGTIKKQNMDSLPEEIKNLLWEKRIPGMEEQFTPETFIDLYSTILVDDVLYVKSEDEWTVQHLRESDYQRHANGELPLRMTYSVHCIIYNNSILKNRYGYDGSI